MVKGTSKDSWKEWHTRESTAGQSIGFPRRKGLRREVEIEADGVASYGMVCDKGCGYILCIQATI